jgi:5-oxoprolinase (ATP-hydrolysing)
MIVKSTDNSAFYLFFIDTGGTFTDCIVKKPDGNTLRRKILSSSALRGVAIIEPDNEWIKISPDEHLCDDFFKGYQFLLLNDPEKCFTITGYSSERSAITLKESVKELPKGEFACEIQSPEEAPVFAARLITNTPIGENFPPIKMRLATTKGTNALLERQGGNSLFLITEGFKDLLNIRNQQRPELFTLNIQKPKPYYRHIVEVPERLDASGNVLLPLDIDELRERIEPLIDKVDSAGICLMHSYLNSTHEQMIEELLNEMGIRRVSRSSALSSSIKIVPRAITTDVNAFLSPVMDDYLEKISAVLERDSLRIMTSAGTLAKAESYTPKDGLLSGPAGGVIGAAAIGKRVAKKLSGLPHKKAGKDPSDLSSSKKQTASDAENLKKKNPTGMNEIIVPEDPSDLPSEEIREFSNTSDPKQKNPTDLLKIISFDMGGTSTDVARFDGQIDYIYEHTVGDATLSAPAVDIETVAAGGGSICGFDGQSLTVGPESAGADPGPACYGRGGPLTITDVNLLLGRINPVNFHISIDTDAAAKRLKELMDQINSGSKTPLIRNQILMGFLDIANERMAQAIRKISIQKGFDPREYSLVAFGGAGAQHAMTVAEKLNIKNVLVPSDAGLLSARGLQQARLEEISSKQILKPLRQISASLTGLFEHLISDVAFNLQQQGIAAHKIEITRKQLFLRFKNQDTSIEIDWDPSTDIEEKFKCAYTEQYGHWLEAREIEVEAIRVKVSEVQNGETTDADTDISFSEEVAKKAVGSSSGERVYIKSDFKPGAVLRGPALILDPYSTTVIEPGWEGELLDDGTWLMKGLGKKDLSGFKNLTGLDSNPASSNRSDAVNLQLYTNRFRAVADQMGEMLRKTSMSVNVKERLDYSCALLDRDGYLVVNAPHIPVHLGAMGTCVREIIRYVAKDPADFNSQKHQNTTDSRPSVNINPPDHFQEGDIIITNHPAFGGSHLPDVTVITPVFFAEKLIGFTASRAHHAEIGGKRPGSMPPDANNLSEEGVVIPPIFLAKAGNFDWDTITDLLKNSPWPSRSVDENLADIQSAVAANHRGARELQLLAKTYGPEQLSGYMQKLKGYAEARMGATLQKITDGTYRAVEKLDDGTELHVTCKVEGQKMSIDFSGTSGVHPGNLNANPSIVNSVIMYVLRLMIDEPLPLNDGLLNPVEIIIPKGMLNPDFPDDPEKCPAVVGGNIEVSQRLADTLLKAFGLAACSYGTMNNVLFGNESFGYYETVAGGTGAGEGFHGADAVHQHMTNTRAADPEILEHRYPVRLDRYSIRELSGGSGKWSGGNGLIREMTFLEPVSLSVLAQHRVIPPYGLDHGQPGKTGRHWVEFKNGTKKELSWRDGVDLNPGDRFILHTPGGGGVGED